MLHTLTAAAFSFQLTERRALLENDIAPLTQAQATVSQAVTALNQEAGRSEMADGYQKQEIREWYNGTCIERHAGCAFFLVWPQTTSCGAAVASALSAQTGLEIEVLNDGTGVDKRKKLTIGIRSYYTQAPASADDSAMDMDIP